MIFIRAIATLALLMAANVALAGGVMQGDAAAGEALVGSCAACTPIATHWSQHFVAIPKRQMIWKKGCQYTPNEEPIYSCQKKHIASRQQSISEQMHW